MSGAGHGIGLGSSIRIYMIWLWILFGGLAPVSSNNSKIIEDAGLEICDLAAE